MWHVVFLLMKCTEKLLFSWRLPWQVCPSFRFMRSLLPSAPESLGKTERSLSDVALAQECPRYITIQWSNKMLVLYIYIHIYHASSSFLLFFVHACRASRGLPHSWGLRDRGRVFCKVARVIKVTKDYAENVSISVRFGFGCCFCVFLLFNFAIFGSHLESLSEIHEKDPWIFKTPIKRARKRVSSSHCNTRFLCLLNTCYSIFPRQDF